MMIKYFNSFSILCLLTIFCNITLQAQVAIIDQTIVNIYPGTIVTTDGSVVIQNAGAIDNSGTIQLKGDWTNNASGLINQSPGTVTFNGSTNQTVGGTTVTSFHNLNIDNSSGVTLANNENVDSALVFTAGIINTGTDTLSLTANPPVAISGANASSYVNGNLRVAIPNGNSTVKYEIGGSVYAPATLVMRAVTTPGNVTGFTAAGVSPNEDNPFTNASQIALTGRANEYWLINNTGAIFTDYDVTLDFTHTANTGDPFYYIVRKFDLPSVWSTPVSLGSAPTITALGLNSFSEFVVGNPTGTVSITDVQSDESSAELFPNPAHNDITLKFSSPSSSHSIIRVTDVTGRIVMSADVDAAKGLNLYPMNIDNLNAGIYTISIQNPMDKLQIARMAVE